MASKDYDTDSIPTDSDEEVDTHTDTAEAEEEDFAAAAARRRLEHKALQAQPVGVSTAPTTQTHTIRADPYAKLPMRYRDSRPSTAGTTASLSDLTVGFKDAKSPSVQPATAIVASGKGAREVRNPDEVLRSRTETLLEEADAALRLSSFAEKQDTPAEAFSEAPPPVQAVQTAPLEDAQMDITDDLLSKFSPNIFANMLERESFSTANLQAAHPGANEWTDSLSADHKFDLVQSVLEDMVESDAKFLRLQRRFKDKHCTVFEDKEENKLEYTTIHNEWVATVERYIDRTLAKSIPGFAMQEFMDILEDRGDEVSGDVWTLLHSFTDFQIFKESMLLHKYGGEEDTMGLSRTDLAKIMNDAQKVMDKHFVSAQKEKDARIAEEALLNAGLGKGFMSLR